MIALVDADIIVFRSGFAAERNQWFLSVGGELPETFAYKREATARLDELLPGIHSRVEGEDYQMWAEKYLEPVENALHNVRQTMNRIMSKLELTEFDVRLYLSGGKNFRYAIAKTKPYKGTRDEKHRPSHEEAIKEYMKRTWDTYTTDGIEADDAIGIAAGPDTIIVSTDKDLDMIPGRHYNWVEDVDYEVTKEQAWRNFCIQLLMGDTVDNIPGLPGVGKVKAAQMLEGQEDLLEEVARCYASRSKKEDWFKYLTEQANLLWILQDGETEVKDMLRGLDELGGDPLEGEQYDLF